MIRFVSAMAAIAFAATMTVTADVPAANAEELSSEQIIEGLSKRKKSRSMAPPQDNSELIDRLRKGKSRLLTIERAEEVAKIVKEGDVPTVDMEVFFDFNSSAITPAAVPTMIELGKALGDERLSGSTFLIAGHTDAVGSDAYNLDLSQRRALSVRQYLAQNFGIEDAQLFAVGYGETQLKNPGEPDSGVNRRVAVIRLVN